MPSFGMDIPARFPLAIFQQFGAWEIFFLLLLALLLFGGKRLPELARGLGKALREFRKATDDAEESLSEALEKPETPLKKSPKSQEVKQDEKAD